MTARQAVLVVIHFDESKLETGLWCPDCNLPSGWRVPLLSLSESGVGQFGTIARCYDCERPLNPEADR